MATILTSLESFISKDDVVTIALEGKYENVFGIIAHREPFLDLKTIRSMLITEEMQLKSRAQATSIHSSSTYPMILLIILVISSQAGQSGQSGQPGQTGQYVSLRQSGQPTNLGYSDQLSGHEAILPNAFSAMTLQDPAAVNWNMDTGASSHLNDFFVRDKHCTIEFDAFGFSVKDFMTRQVLLHYDSTGDLYPITKPSTIPHAFLTSQYTWH
ncbi:hypothetical protein Tco_1150466 [Tanacetum coccineum]